MLVVMRGLRRFDQGGTSSKPQVCSPSRAAPLDPSRTVVLYAFSDLVWVLREVALVPRS